MTSQHAHFSARCSIFLSICNFRCEFGPYLKTPLTIYFFEIRTFGRASPRLPKKSPTFASPEAKNKDSPPFPSPRQSFMREQQFWPYIRRFGGAGSYRPSLVEFSRDANKARNGNAGPSSRAPISCGWDFDAHKGHLVIEPGTEEYCDSEFAFRSVDAITAASSTEKATPVKITSVLMLQFRYGFPEQATQRSSAYARANAFAS